MPDQQVLSVAVFDLIASREQECLRLLQDFYRVLQDKGYGTNLLFRDTKSARRYINVRFWNSEQKQKEAAEDPEVHRYWLRLPELLEMQTVYERLEAVPGFANEK